MAFADVFLVRLIGLPIRIAKTHRLAEVASATFWLVGLKVFKWPSPRSAC
jgi:hypothetical protein